MPSTCGMRTGSSARCTFWMRRWSSAARCTSAAWRSSRSVTSSTTPMVPRARPVVVGHDAPAAFDPVDRAVGPDAAVEQHVGPGIGHDRLDAERRTRPGRRDGSTPSSRRRCPPKVPGAMPCIASRRASQTVRPVSSSQYHVPSCAASSASCRCSCSSRLSTTLPSFVPASGVPGRPDATHCHGRGWSLPTMRRAVYWCGDRTRPPPTVSRMVALAAPLSRPRARARSARG